jgi:hypothetical protein
MKTIQVNDSLLEAAKAYITYIEKPLEHTQEEQGHVSAELPSFFNLLGRFVNELAQAIVESEGKTEGSV